jgi:hypothetical protein
MEVEMEMEIGIGMKRKLDGIFSALFIGTEQKSSSSYAYA